MLKKIICFFILSALLVSCGSARNRNQAAAPLLPGFEMSIRPLETLNPHAVGKDSACAFVAGLITGSLTEADPESPAGERRYIGAMAEDLPSVSADGMVWTYRIREGLIFSDGTPIDAHAFEYAMRMWLDPRLAYPSARRFWGPVKIAGARAYAMGEGGVGWNDVGVFAPNRLTLQITLEEPVPTPVGLETLNIPLVNREFYEAGMEPARGSTSYGAPEGILDFPVSGPYRVAEYIPGERITLEKNGLYPNFFKYDAERLHIFPDGGDEPKRGGNPWFIYINTDNPGVPALADENLRKALFYGLNRSYVIGSIEGGYTPIAGFVPQASWVGDAMTGLRMYGDLPEAAFARPSDYGMNTRLALEYFEKAFENNGNEKITIYITVFDEPEDWWGRLAIGVRDWWTQLFGGVDRFHLLLDFKTADEAYRAMESGEYEMAFGALTHNSIDVWATMAVWTSYYPGKLDSFYSAEFDKLQYECAFGELMTDYAGKIDALIEMERMLYEYVPAIPFFHD
ncbi:MAG: ABC transporter substrate-binding protein [Defluviitaleaceae bacterium]|nr:ABC transporter substrate-binding protein [Defluviitaleaceae bacterium]MCL2835129.1 ABC transporter substrate-binding protein [Defluviitaleaceae bacterium]